VTVHPDKLMALTTDAVGFAEGAEYVVTTSTLSCIIDLCSDRNPRISYLDLLRGIRCVSESSVVTLPLIPHALADSHRAILSTKYSQKPQLSSSHIMVRE